MKKKYRSQILAALFHNKRAATDISPLIQQLEKENIFNRLYFIIVLEGMRDNELISYTDDGYEIWAKLLPRGIAEYKRLNRHAQKNTTKTGYQ